MGKYNSKIGRPKSPIYGVGINDADYVVTPLVDGKQVWCKIYQTWNNILKRVYNDRVKEKNPTYINATICDEWHSFMVFRAWVISQDWKGKQIDKDIITPGNKHYSPNNCVFVTREINMILAGPRESDNNLPQGVCRDRKTYRSRCRVNGKNIYIGNFYTPEDASFAYRAFKHNHITEVANQQTDIRIKDGLLRHAQTYLGTI